ncbi:hypothetical protein BDY24DRAFT_382616 [Mrakia frigida]|uniref:thioesterase family protein n=1 Tax=Mrakia frigida TaxID=29902 RepID=UPI003FCC256E
MDALISTWDVALSYVPRWVKVVVVVLLIVNFRAFPLYWHCKVWWPAILSHIRAQIFGLLPYLSSLPSVGADWKTISSERSFVVLPDGLDFQLHMSNSVYARELDASRMQAFLHFFTPMFQAGCWIGLGSAHYVFYKELPPFAQYEIEVTIDSFDEKWFYICANFITRPKKRTVSSSIPSSPSGKDKLQLPPSPSFLHAPRPPLSRSNTPLPPTRSDGATVHAVSVSAHCFKIGRLTLQPALVLSYCGFGKEANWIRSLALVKAGKLQSCEFLRGGWKQEIGLMEEFDGRRNGAKGEILRDTLSQFR